MSRQGQAQDRTAENVRDFWNREAEEWGHNPQVTIRDHYFRLLELNLICQLIKGRSKVLDIGCGTGFSTLFYGQEVREIVGADFAQSMVRWARRFLDDAEYFRRTMAEYAAENRIGLRGNIRFEEGNILDLKYPAATFDAVVAERVLINLPTVALHDQAVTEVARILAPGGRWLLVEVTQQGHETVDRLRGMFGLSIIEKYWHNLYVEEPHLAEAVKATGLTIQSVRRFETFHFLTKVMHPLIVAPAEPKFLAGFNNAARWVAEEFPTYRDVAALGLERFLREKFRPHLERFDPEKLPRFDLVSNEIVRVSPDFSGCSHQVLFVLDKPGA